MISAFDAAPAKALDITGLPAGAALPQGSTIDPASRREPAGAQGQSL